MKQSGIDRSVVLPVVTSPRQVMHINDSAALINAQYGAEGLHSFGGIHPEYSDWKYELSRIAALGLKGVKLHPVFQQTDFDDLRYLRILERAGELGLVVVTHAGIDIGYPGMQQCTPEKIRRAVLTVGPIKLVAAHMGGWHCWKEAEQLLVNTNIYFDTAFALGRFTPRNRAYTKEETQMLSQEQFVCLVRRFGAKRILFGTDSPWSEQADSLHAIRNLPLESEEKAAILADNACRLLT